MQRASWATVSAPLHIHLQQGPTCFATDLAPGAVHPSSDTIQHDWRVYAGPFSQRTMMTFEGMLGWSAARMHCVLEVKQAVKFKWYSDNSR